MSPAVTIAVVSWNTRELLRACLRSLSAEVDAGRAEVWVVDNASTDGSAEAVEREFPWASLIASRDNLGFGRAVNEVAARTGAPWIAPANADVELAPGALETLVAAGESDQRAGAVAPRLVMPNGLVQHSVHPFPTVGLAAVFNLGVHRLVPGLGDRLCLEGRWDPERPRYVDWAHGAFLLVRREAFDSVGGFDPAQWLYAEDIDLAWRLRRAGWRVRYEPTAAVRHEVSAATRQAFAEERLSRHVRATYAWMARRRGMSVTWAVTSINVAGAGARWLGLAPLAVVAPHRWGPRRDLARCYVAAHRQGLRRRATLLEQG